MTGKGSSQPGPRVDVLPPAWWADEMLGRLARYLRIVGLDTAYVRGIDDDEILRRSIDERRVLITRDRELAHRAPRSVLLSTVHIQDQWRELRTRFPGLPNEPRFERCTVCNGRLLAVPPSGSAASIPAVPPRVLASHEPLFRCATCGHLYWEGSHTASVRRRLTEWSPGAAP
ncbi:MAG TPA: Mut7-C RNAse domain-containing protein [Thermoplasmata archaeon]|nr:Mut7-C RNAse domain-containing protein [Thermoplasmata archaeon]